MGRLKKLFANRKVTAIVALVTALLLLFLVWKVFFGEEKRATPYGATEEEKKLSALLCSLDGVDEATVMISTEEGKAVSAVIVFDGEDKLLLRMNILSAASAALNLPRSSVHVYSSAEKKAATN